MSGIPKTLMSEVMPSWWHATLNKKSIEALVLTGNHGDFAAYPKKNGDKVYICVNDHGKMVQYSIVIVNPHECRFAGIVSPNIEQCVNDVIELSRNQPFASKSKPNAGLSLKDPVQIQRQITSTQQQMSKSLFDDDDDDFDLAPKPQPPSPERKKPESTAPTMTSKVAAMLADDVDDDFELPTATPLADVIKSADDIEVSFVKTSAAVGLVVLDPPKGQTYPMVSEVLSTSPAAGLLNAKDEIIGVNGKSMQGQKKAAVLGIIRAASSTSKLTFVIKRPAPKVKKSPIKAAPKTMLHKVAPVPTPTQTPTSTPTPASTPTKLSKPLVVKQKTSATTKKESNKNLFDDMEDDEEESAEAKKVVAEPKSLFTEEDDEETDDDVNDDSHDDNDDNITDDGDDNGDNKDDDVRTVGVKKTDKVSLNKTTTAPKKRSIFDDEDEDEEISGGDDDDELDDLLGDDVNDDDLDSLMNSKQTKPKTTTKSKKKGSSLFDDDDDDGIAASGGDFDVTDLGSLQQYLKANEGK
eukprot:m.222633 g.222633  ORF g.222633 m.222633 type:complete len:523 (-) comp33379_c0_seq4:253-1821(-)